MMLLRGRYASCAHTGLSCVHKFQSKVGKGFYCCENLLIVTSEVLQELNVVCQGGHYHFCLAISSIDLPSTPDKQ